MLVINRGAEESVATAPNIKAKVCSVVVLLLALFLVDAHKGFALEKSDDIDTNRPSFCQSAIVVPKGSLQFENGGLYQHFQHGFTYFDVPETELRLGLTRSTEFQVFAPQFTALWQRRGPTNIGVTDLSEIGLKQQIGPIKPLRGLVASAVASLNVPTGAKIFSGERVEPVFRLPYAVPINSKWTFCGMQSLEVLNNGRNVVYEPFVMVNRAFGSKNRVVAFAEYAGFFTTRHVPDVQIAHFGSVYKLNKNNQVDINFGFGMDRAAPAALVGVGYSYRFDKLPWGNK